uniref:Muscle-specific beta 1 integrin binding protein 2 n=1 Tax=Amphiprion percula TaxID=161767 RepID=A0A3P8TB45_AMPPE
MKTNMMYIICISGVTNGGKTNRLIKILPNCCVQYDVITALDMDAMMTSICGWRTGWSLRSLMSDHKEEEETHIVIVEGFLLYTYRALNDVLNHRYFISIPYEECKKRRCSRNYTVSQYLAHVFAKQEHHGSNSQMSNLKSKTDIFLSISQSTLPFKSLGSLKNLLIFERKQFFSNEDNIK